MTIHYIEGNNPRDVMEAARDNLHTLRNRVDSTLQTIDGLMGGALQYDPRSVLMVAELIASLEDVVGAAGDRITIELLHMEDAPATNVIARAVGKSVGKVNRLNEDVAPFPEEEDES